MTPEAQQTIGVLSQIEEDVRTTALAAILTEIWTVGEQLARLRRVSDEIAELESML